MPMQRLFAVLLIAWFTLALSATVSFTSASGGDFDNAALWSTGTVPTEDDDVIISICQSTSTSKIVVDQPFTVKSLTFGGDVSECSPPHLAFSRGRQLSVTDFTWISGNMYGSGSIPISGLASIQSTLGKRIYSVTKIIVNPGATFQLEADSSFTIGKDSRVAISNGGTLHVAGNATIYQEDSSAHIWTVGDLVIDNGAVFDVQVSLKADGAVSVDDGSLIINDGGYIAGALTVSSTSSLVVEQPFEVRASGSLEGDGECIVRSTINVLGEFRLTGDVTMDGGYLIFSSGSRTIELNLLDLPEGTNLIYDDGSIIEANAMELHVTGGSLDIRSGALFYANDVVLYMSGDTSVFKVRSNGQLTFESILLEDGLLDLDPEDTEFIEVSDSFTMTGGKVRTDLYFEFGSSCAVTIGGGEFDVAQTFDVPLLINGDVEKTFTQAVVFETDVTFSHSGSLVATSLEISGNSSFVNCADLAEITTSDYMDLMAGVSHVVDGCQLNLNGVTRYRGSFIFKNGASLNDYGVSRLYSSSVDGVSVVPTVSIYDSSSVLLTALQDSTLEASLYLGSTESLFKVDDIWSLYSVSDFDVSGNGTVWINAVDDFVVKSSSFAFNGILRLTGTRFTLSGFESATDSFPAVIADSSDLIVLSDVVFGEGFSPVFDVTLSEGSSLDFRPVIDTCSFTDLSLSGSSSAVFTDQLDTSFVESTVGEDCSLIFSSAVEQDVSFTTLTSAGTITFSTALDSLNLGVASFSGSSTFSVVSSVGSLSATSCVISGSATLSFADEAGSVSMDSLSLLGTSSNALRFEGTVQGDFIIDTLIISQATMYVSAIGGKFKSSSSVTISNQGRLNVQGVGGVVISSLSITDSLTYCWFIRSISGSVSVDSLSINGYNSQLFLAENSGITIGTASLASNSKIVVAGSVLGYFKFTDDVDLGSGTILQVLGSVSNNLVFNGDLSGSGTIQIRDSFNKFVVGGTLSLLNFIFSSFNYVDVHIWNFDSDTSFSYETIGKDFVVDSFIFDTNGSVIFSDISEKVLIKQMVCNAPFSLTVNGGTETYASNTVDFSGQCSVSYLDFGSYIRLSGDIDISSLSVISSRDVQLPSVVLESGLSVSATDFFKFKRLDIGSGSCSIVSPEITGLLNSEFILSGAFCSVSSSGVSGSFVDLSKTTFTLDSTVSFADGEEFLLPKVLTSSSASVMNVSNFSTVSGSDFDFVGTSHWVTIDSISVDSLTVSGITSFSDVSSFSVSDGDLVVLSDFSFSGLESLVISGSLVVNSALSVALETLSIAGDAVLNAPFTVVGGDDSSLSVDHLIVSDTVSVTIDAVTAGSTTLSASATFSSVASVADFGNVIVNDDLVVNCDETGSVEMSSFSGSGRVIFNHCISTTFSTATTLEDVELDLGDTVLNLGDCTVVDNVSLTATSLMFSNLEVQGSLNLVDVGSMEGSSLVVSSTGSLISNDMVGVSVDTISSAGPLSHVNLTTVSCTLSSSLIDSVLTVSGSLSTATGFSLNGSYLILGGDSDWNTAMCTIPLGIGSTVSIVGDMISTCGSAFKFDGPESTLIMSGSFSGADLSSMVIDCQMEFSDATITLLTASELTLSGHSEGCGAAHIISPSLTTPVIVENTNPLCIGATSTVSVPTSSVFKALSGSELVYGGFVPNQPTFSTNEGVIRLQGTATYDSVTVDDLVITSDSALHFTSTIPAFPNVMIEANGTMGLHDVSFEVLSLSVSGSLVSDSEAEITTPEFVCEGCSCVGNITIIAETVSINGSAMFDGCVVQVSDTFALSEGSELTGANSAHVLLTESASDLTLKSVSLPVTDGSATFEFSSTLTLDTVEMDWALVAHGDVYMVDDSFLNGGGEFDGLFDMSDDILVTLDGVSDYIFSESSRIVGDSVDFVVGGSGATAYVNGYYGLNPNMTFNSSDMTFTETAVVNITSLVVDGGTIEVSNLAAEDIASLSLVQALNGGKIIFRSLPCALDIAYLDLSGEIIFENLTYPISLGVLLLSDGVASFIDLPTLSFDSLQLDNTTLTLSTGQDVSITNLEMLGPSVLNGTDLIHLENFAWKGGEVGSSMIVETTLATTDEAKGLIDDSVFSAAGTFVIGDSSVILSLAENTTLRFESDMAFGAPAVNFIAPVSNGVSTPAGSLVIASTLALPLQSYFEVDVSIEGVVVVEDASAVLFVTGNLTINGSLTFTNTASFKFGGYQFLLDSDGSFTGPATIVELQEHSTSTIRGQMVCYPTIAISNASVLYDGAVFTLTSLTLVDGSHAEFVNLESDLELTTVQLQDSSLVVNSIEGDIEITTFSVLSSTIEMVDVQSVSFDTSNIQNSQFIFNSSESSVSLTTFVGSNDEISIIGGTISFADFQILSSNVSVLSNSINASNLTIDMSDLELVSSGSFEDITVLESSSVSFVGDLTVDTYSLLSNSTGSVVGNLSAVLVEVNAGAVFTFVDGTLYCGSLKVDDSNLAVNGSGLEISTFQVADSNIEIDLIDSFSSNSFSLINSVFDVEVSSAILGSVSADDNCRLSISCVTHNATSYDVQTTSIVTVASSAEHNIGDILVDSASWLSISGSGLVNVDSATITDSSQFSIDGNITTIGTAVTSINSVLQISSLSSLSVSDLTSDESSISISDSDTVSLAGVTLSSSSVFKIEGVPDVIVTTLSSIDSSIAVTTEAGISGSSISGSNWSTSNSPMAFSNVDSVLFDHVSHSLNSLSFDGISVTMNVGELSTDSSTIGFSDVTDLTISSWISSDSDATVTSCIGDFVLGNVSFSDDSSLLWNDSALLENVVFSNLSLISSGLASNTTLSIVIEDFTFQSGVLNTVDVSVTNSILVSQIGSKVLRTASLTVDCDGTFAHDSIYGTVGSLITITAGSTIDLVGAINFMLLSDNSLEDSLPNLVLDGTFTRTAGVTDVQMAWFLKGSSTGSFVASTSMLTLYGASFDGSFILTGDALLLINGVVTFGTNSVVSSESSFKFTTLSELTVQGEWDLPSSQEFTTGHTIFDGAHIHSLKSLDVNNTIVEMSNLVCDDCALERLMMMSGTLTIDTITSFSVAEMTLYASEVSILNVEDLGAFESSLISSSRFSVEQAVEIVDAVIKSCELLSPEITVSGLLEFQSSVQKEIENNTVLTITGEVRQSGQGPLVVGNGVAITITSTGKLNLSTSASFGVATGYVASLVNNGQLIKGADTGSTTIGLVYSDSPGSEVIVGENSEILFAADLSTSAVFSMASGSALAISGDDVTFLADCKLIGTEADLNLMSSDTVIHLYGEYSLNPAVIVRSGLTQYHPGAILNIDSLTVVAGEVLMDGVSSDETNFTLTYIDVIGGSVKILNAPQTLEFGAMQVRSGSLEVSSATKDIYISSSLAILTANGDLTVDGVAGQVFLNTATFRGTVNIQNVVGDIIFGSFSVLDEATVTVSNVNEMITSSSGLSLGTSVRVDFLGFTNFSINGPIITGDDVHLTFESFDFLDVAGAVVFSDRTSATIHDGTGRVFFAGIVSGQVEVDISIDEILGSVQFNDSVNVIQDTYFGVASTPLLIVRNLVTLGPSYEFVLYDIEEVSIGQSLRAESTGEAHIQDVHLLSIQNVELGSQSSLNITESVVEIVGDLTVSTMSLLTVSNSDKFAVGGELTMDGTALIQISGCDTIEFHETVFLNAGSQFVLKNVANLMFAMNFITNGTSIEFSNITDSLLFNESVVLFNSDFKFSSAPGLLQFSQPLVVGNFTYMLIMDTVGLLLESTLFVDQYAELNVMDISADIVFEDSTVFLGNTTFERVEDIHFAEAVDILGSFRIDETTGSLYFTSGIMCGDACTFDLLNIGEDILAEDSVLLLGEGVGNITNVGGEILINATLFSNDYSSITISGVNSSIGITNVDVDYDSQVVIEEVVGDLIVSETIEAQSGSTFSASEFDGGVYVQDIIGNDSAIVFSSILGCVHVLDTVNTVEGYFEISQSPCVEVTGKVYSSSEVVFEGISGYVNFSEIELYGETTFDSIEQINTQVVYVPGRWVMKNITKKIYVEETFTVSGDVRFMNVTVVDVTYIDVQNGTTQFAGNICSSIPETICDNCSLSLGPFPSEIPEQCIEDDNAVRCPADDPFCNLPGFPPDCPTENGVNPYCPVCPSNRTECGGTTSPCLDDSVTVESNPECFSTPTCVSDPDNEICVTEAACPDDATEETHPDCFEVLCPADATVEEYPDCFTEPCPEDATIDEYPECFNEPECTTESTNEECMIEAKCPGDDPDCTVDPVCAAGDTEGDCGVAPYCDRYPNSTECQPEAPICPGSDERCTITAECKFANGSLDYSNEDCIVTGKCVGEENLDNPECLVAAVCPDPANPDCTTDSYCDTYPDDEECTIPALCGVNGSLYGTDEYNETCTVDLCTVDPENDLCQPTPLCEADPTNENCQSRPICQVDPDNELCQYTPLCSDPDNLANHEDCQYQALCEVQPEHENCQPTPVCSLEADDPRILANEEIAAQYSTLCEWQALCDVDPDHLFCKWRPLCLADPENELCQWQALCEVDPDNTFCKWTPTCLSDPDSLLCQSRPLCLVNPEHENCQWTWLCDEDPDHAFCKNRSLCVFNPDHEYCQNRSLCDVYPEDELCKQTRFCDENPSHYTCDPDFCTRNPTSSLCGSIECVICPDAGDDLCGANPCADPDDCMVCGVPIPQPKYSICRWVPSETPTIRWADVSVSVSTNDDEESNSSYVSWPPLAPSIQASGGSVVCESDDGCNIGNLVAESMTAIGGTAMNVSIVRLDNSYVESPMTVENQLEIVGQPSALAAEIVSNGETVLDTVALYGAEGASLTNNGDTLMQPGCEITIEPLPVTKVYPTPVRITKIVSTPYCATHYCGGSTCRSGCGYSRRYRPCSRYCSWSSGTSTDGGGISIGGISLGGGSSSSSGGWGVGIHIGGGGSGSSHHFGGGHSRGSGSHTHSGRRCRGCSSHVTKYCYGCYRTRVSTPSAPSVTVIC